MQKLTMVVALVAVVAALPSVAQAKRPEVLRTGSCSNGADWKLKAKNEDGNRLEIEFEVDQNVNGRRWTVTITRDGVRVFRGVRTTRPPSGSFSVNRRPANPAGSDRIVAVARTASGATCRGALTV
jgi:hypothetical protein